MSYFITHVVDKPAKGENLRAEYVLEHGVRFRPDREGVQEQDGLMKGTATLFYPKSEVYVASKGKTVVVPENAEPCTWTLHQDPGEPSVLVVTLTEATLAEVIPLLRQRPHRRMSRPNSNG